MAHLVEIYYESFNPNWMLELSDSYQFNDVTIFCALAMQVNKKVNNISRTSGITSRIQCCPIIRVNVVSFFLSCFCVLQSVVHPFNDVWYILFYNGNNTTYGSCNQFLKMLCAKYGWFIYEMVTNCNFGMIFYWIKM